MIDFYYQPTMRIWSDVEITSNNVWYVFKWDGHKNLTVVADVHIGFGAMEVELSLKFLISINEHDTVIITA